MYLELLSFQLLMNAYLNCKLLIILNFIFALVVLASITKKKVIERPKTISTIVLVIEDHHNQLS
jgi:hypothetical protein